MENKTKDWEIAMQGSCIGFCEGDEEEIGADGEANLV
jgi:hypothetical protein